jgi:DNA-binding transcriptional LysR family regulator
MDRIMEISQDQIKSFLKIAECKNISRAAKLLGITQPALSTKLKRLELDLGLVLMVRSKAGIALTQEGLRFLHYSQTRLALEHEMLSKVVNQESEISEKDKLEETVRIVGHYSILHHCAVPALRDLFLNNPKLMLHLIVKEDAQVPDVLTGGMADFALLQAPLRSVQFEHAYLGDELYVAVESKKANSRPHVYLDSDPGDSMTEKFFSIQKRQKPKDYARSFFHDENGIGRGVALGLGRAVLAQNEVQYQPGIRMIQGYLPFRLPAYLHWLKQPYSSRAHRAVKDEILRNSKKYLASS